MSEQAQTPEKTAGESLIDFVRAHNEPFNADMSYPRCYNPRILEITDGQQLFPFDRITVEGDEYSNGDDFHTITVHSSVLDVAIILTYASKDGELEALQDAKLLGEQRVKKILDWLQDIDSCSQLTPTQQEVTA
jgi:hypothetical protein